MTVPKYVIGLGEVLWDVFPDGARFGGAPANFACSAAGIGGNTLHVAMASAVGSDKPGQQALVELEQRGVDVQFMEPSEFPTGQVFVSLNTAGQASYKFLEDTAWDNIVWSEKLHQLALKADAVCFGTLGQRSEISRESIRRFVSHTRKACLRILDINLRPPYWNESVVLQSLPLANVLKLNDDELSIVGSMLSLQGNEEALLQQLMQRFSFDVIALTRGANGSIILDSSGQRSEIDGQRVKVVDTVGAGDAFTAALVVGLLCGRSLPDTHRLAADVAAFVCTQPGATPAFPVSLTLQGGTL